MKKGILKGIGIIKHKFSHAKHLLEDNSAEVREIISIMQKDNFKISEETYKKEYLPLNKYYKKEQYNSNPILYIAVVSFNQKHGAIIEFTYPDKEELFTNENSQSFLTSLIDPNNKKLDSIEKIFDNINNQLTYLCMPDGAHSLTSDSQFFLIQNFSKILFGISCYRQLQVTQAMKEDEQENTRDCVQKAMCIISKLPLFGQMASKLSITMLAYFNQDSLKDKKIIQDLYSNYPNNYMSRIQVSEILESFSLKRLIYFLKSKIFVLIKLILLEKRILIYSHVSNNVCTFIFSFLSLFPGGVFFSLDNEGRAKSYYNCYTPYGLPLKFLNTKSVLYSIMTLYDIEEIEKKDIISFFIGTTNPLFLTNKKLNYDCIINLDNNNIVINKNITHSVIHKGNIERGIMEKIYNHCKSLFNDDQSNNTMDDNWMLDYEKDLSNFSTEYKKTKKKNSVKYNVQNEEFNLKFEGSDDYIRNIFTKYFTNFLADMSLVEKFLNTNDEKEKKFSNIKEILNDYNCDFIIKWITTTKNFKYWDYEHDEQLWRFSPHLKKCKNVIKHYENGNLYEGELSFGEPNNNGKLNYYIKEIKYTYQGIFKKGKKNGKGNLYSEDNKFNYEGDFKNDQFDGYGTLYDHDEKYTGEFKENKFNGKGTLFSVKGYVLNGEFVNGKANGNGEMVITGGDVYNGNFEDGLFNGKGCMKYKNIGVYNGNFFFGKKKGYGKFEYNNGDVYEGYFDNDLYNGDGVLTKKNGEVMKGIFKNGEFVEKNDDLILEKDDIFNWEDLGKEREESENKEKIEEDNINKINEVCDNNNKMDKISDNFNKINEEDNNSI